jgi:hypothetical protein
MDFMPKQIFHREIERQCTFALMAYEDLRQALVVIQQPYPKPPVPNSSDVTQIRQLWPDETNGGRQWTSITEQRQGSPGIPVKTGHRLEVGLIFPMV